MGRMKEIMLMIEDGMSFEDIAKHMNKSPRFDVLICEFYRKFVSA